MNNNFLQVTLGNEKADLVIKNGQLVNVYSKEIYQADVAVKGNKIAAIGNVDYTIGESTEIINASGKYILPGFIDGHIHPESSCLSIRQFTEVVINHGTTSVMADMHEVGVVGGLEAIEAVLEEAEITPLKIYFVVPSHVPFCGELETSGGTFNAETIRKAFQRKDAVGLSEIVGPYLLMGNEELLAGMNITKENGKSLQGHLPDIKGPALQYCLASGVSTDHESLGTEDALERIRLGCHVMMREGSAARNLQDCIKIITEKNLDPTMCSIITDDLHVCDVVYNGHLDEAIRTALKCGVDFITAVQMVTLNPARAFNLDREIGSIVPGRHADINICSGPEDFKVDTVICAGEVMVKDGELLKHFPVADHKDILLNTVKLQRPVTPEDFEIRVEKPEGTATVKVMNTLPWIPITFGQDVDLEIENYVIKCDIEKDVVYIAQVERHGKNGNIGKAFMGGFNLKSGAIASTVGHDNHNIIVMGTNHQDMAFAVNRLNEIQGGQVAVENEKVLYEVPYPVLGLLSDLDAWALAEEKTKLNKCTYDLGCTIKIPFMFLSFISLAAIPEYAITDKGFIDVLKQQIINPVLEIK